MDQRLIPNLPARNHWHNRLAAVVHGDIVKSERKRIESFQNRRNAAKDLSYEIWVALRAKAANVSVAFMEQSIDG